MPLLPYSLSLAHTPAILSRTIAHIPPERRSGTREEDRFDLLEMVAHLADSEAIFSARMRAAVEEDVPEFARLDMGQRAIDERYAERSLYEELALFAARRAETVAFVEGLTDAELDREFVQAFGRMSVREFVGVLTGHDLYHLEQASSYLSASPH